jgi:hypothetical protein
LHSRATELASRIAVLGYLQLEVVFEDGRKLLVEFDPERLTGPLAFCCEVDEFAAAYLRHGTVAWPCGATIDNEVASIRADEVEVWRPT